MPSVILYQGPADCGADVNLTVGYEGATRYPHIQASKAGITSAVDLMLSRAQTQRPDAIGSFGAVGGCNSIRLRRPVRHLRTTAQT